MMRHPELYKGLDTRALATMSFENPAVCYCLLGSNQRIDLHRRLRNVRDSKFYRMLSEVEIWERVTGTPDIPEQEYYHIKLSIMGKLCVCDAELWRSALQPHRGYIRVLSIDDTD